MELADRVRGQTPPARPGSPAPTACRNGPPWLQPQRHSANMRRAAVRRQRKVYMTEPDTFVFTDDGAIPNSSLPLLVYRQAVPADAAAIERIFTANRWPAAWRGPVHPFQHFHSDAHEVLGVAEG